jgi:hypothetical protein
MEAKRKIEPQKLKPETLQTVQRVISGLEVMLMQRERNSKRILARIEILMGHYWVGKENDLSAAAKFMDWYEILKSYPFWAIDVACKEWLATETRRPVISQILKLTIDAMAQPQRMKDRLQIVSGVVSQPEEDNGKTWGDMTPEEKKRHNEMMEKIRGAAGDATDKAK